MTDPVPEADALEQRRDIEPAQPEVPHQPDRTDDEAPEEDSLEQSLPVDIDEEEWAHDEER